MVPPSLPVQFSHQVLLSNFMPKSAVICISQSLAAIFMGYIILGGSESARLCAYHKTLVLCERGIVRCSLPAE